MSDKSNARKATNNIAESRRYYEKKTGTKFTQEDAAREFKLGLSTYRNYEQEKSLPDGRVAPIIAKKYGVTVDYLMGLSDVKYYVMDLNDDLKEDEKELIKLYRSLPPKGQHAVLTGLRDFASDK
jgi:transcriptional regulator with XRE-family HTH domain